MKYIFTTFALMALLFCSCHRNKTDSAKHADITAEMAFEGVNNYCHSKYDWNVAKEYSSMMYFAIEEETESDYKVVFRSYTGTFVYFYVDKSSGVTRVVSMSLLLMSKAKQAPSICSII